MRGRWLAAVASAAAAVVLAAPPARAEVQVRLEKVAEGLTHPLGLVEPPDGSKRRFIIEQPGTIRILMPNGRLLDEPFLNIRHKIVRFIPDFDERGLLSLAFHPDFRNNGKFYVAYSGYLNRYGEDVAKMLWYSHTNYVAEYRVSKANANRADPNTERIITAIDWPQFNHNGHWIGFGPDGFLFISVGDGGYANDWGIGHNVTIGNGQDLTALNGKILRVDVNSGDPYGIPRDNPFVGRNDVRPEIWAVGFRNPWRCSFDMGGDRALFCADVGQNSYEEVNIVIRGANHGWRVKEATHCFDYANPDKHPASCNDRGMTDPLFEYKNCNVFPAAECKGLSVTGGYVYRGKHTPWQGRYFFGDWSRQFAVRDGSLYVASKQGNRWVMEDVKVAGMPDFKSYVLAFGQDGDGEVYLMATNVRDPHGAQDTVYRFVAP